MKWNQYFFLGLILVFSFTIIGCSNEEKTTTETIDSIDAEEVLTLDPNADIFQFDDVIYKTNVEWVEELSITKDMQIGEIKTRNVKDTNFKNGVSNKLPVGTKIYSIKERGDILVVEVDSELKKYLAIVEG